MPYAVKYSAFCAKITKKTLKTKEKNINAAFYS